MASLNLNIEIDEEMLKKAIKEVNTDTNDEIWGITNDFISNIRRNIEIANNTYTQMGYEIALELFKSVLEERGYKFDDLFADRDEDF